MNALAERAYVVCTFGGFIWWATRSVTAALACMAATAVMIGLAGLMNRGEDTDRDCQRMDNEGGNQFSQKDE